MGLFYNAPEPTLCLKKFVRDLKAKTAATITIESWIKAHHNIISISTYRDVAVAINFYCFHPYNSFSSPQWLVVQPGRAKLALLYMSFTYYQHQRVAM